MLADVIFILWIIMGGVFGWQRRAAIELYSFIILAVTFIFARLLAQFFMFPIASIFNSRPIDTRLISFLILWLFLHIAVWKLWNAWSIKRKANIRIRYDADGNPIANPIPFWTKLLGFFIGIFRSAFLYAGIISALYLLVPSRFYKNNRGTTLVHPNSISLRWIKQLDPDIRRLEEVTQGLRSLRSLKYNLHRRYRCFKRTSLRQIWKMPQIIHLRRNRKLLSRANHGRQGRRDASLLLWMPAMQETLADATTSNALITLARQCPSPFDRKKSQAGHQKRKKRHSHPSKNHR